MLHTTHLEESAVYPLPHLQSQVPWLAGDYSDWQRRKSMSFLPTRSQDQFCSFLLMGQDDGDITGIHSSLQSSDDMVSTFLLHHLKAPRRPHVNSKNHYVRSGCKSHLIKIQSIGKQWGKSEILCSHLLSEIISTKVKR